MNKLKVILMITGSLSFHAAAVQSSDEKLIPLTATFVAPPCRVSFDNSSDSKIIELGDITYGEQVHSPFSLSVECKYIRGSSVYAEVVTGRVSQNGNDLINMNDAITGQVTPVMLSLREGSQSGGIIYDTSSGTNPDVQFCKGDFSRTCTLSPVTRADSGVSVPAGTQLVAAIRFTIVNP
ncbi:hypothetical protein JKL81_001899 [Salmonella enterica]|uniref:Fimbrial protein n=5 Tax=Salmonella enterica TaxID=28901 RepID=A0A3U9VLY5_SALET|nr:hypothetical protein [Salmonella enterica]EAA3460415.1 hypothetical protein [Salmonella enterica subsp. enterica serovar Miami]EAA4490777.1 hypothetical protein [Salmonella enterica subsp. enterica]EAA6277670.1 hypothetical protein [Salmonella enterica subsp. enterica serovar Telhashomer]EBM1014708.1 hypothetical protein [Salmonella enterica subsp. enterica serovar Paratyphi B]EBQ5851710.1 hypothetical protein [Salmonella enterica subsp. enterica serovar Virchow]ECK9479043.1 hypothetical p